MAPKQYKRDKHKAWDELSTEEQVAIAGEEAIEPQKEAVDLTSNAAIDAAVNLRVLGKHTNQEAYDARAPIADLSDDVLLALHNVFDDLPIAVHEDSLSKEEFILAGERGSDFDGEGTNQDIDRGHRRGVVYGISAATGIPVNHLLTLLLADTTHGQ